MANNDNKLLTAYCGLYCGDCIRYKSKASDLARELVDTLEKIKFSQYSKIKSRSVKALKNYRALKSSLEAIGALQCNIPCRAGGDGCLEPCEIAKCVHSNGFEGCWECSKLDKCEWFDFLEPFHGDTPKKNCRLIKKYGIEDWSDHRLKCYPWL